MLQKDALHILKLGTSVFLTGGAGTGKSHVLKEYIEYLKNHEIPHAVTASTGIAATHIGGVTIHSWSGIGAKEYLNSYDLDALEGRKQLWDRYQRTQVLIIDEISMLSGVFLDTLNTVAKHMRRNELPFGGMQIILCGDLFQLPPVTRGQESLSIDAKAWAELKPAVCYLQEQYRQQDAAFLEILNALRSQTITDEHLSTLQERHSDDETIELDVTITRIYTHNANVDSENEKKLASLAGRKEEYTMHTKGKEHHVQALKKGCLAPEKLILKEGAQVIFVKNNLEKGYVNGTRGEVVGFSSQGFPKVRTTNGSEMLVEAVEWSLENDNGKTIASITQLPLRLAWAITVHKSQGMSLDAAIIDISGAFAPGMGYVALSRVRTLKGLTLTGFSRDALRMHPRIVTFDAKLQQMSRNAEARIQALSKPELTERHEKFIHKTGGSIKVTAANNKKRPSKRVDAKVESWRITLNEFLEGSSLAAIAKKLDITPGTVFNHLEKAVQAGEHVPKKLFAGMITPQLLKKISSACDAVEGTEDVGDGILLKLTPVKDYLEKKGTKCSFDDIRLCRLLRAIR
jgi:hypothetical protein